jgi:hypothetical protein
VAAKTVIARFVTVVARWSVMFAKVTAMYSRAQMTTSDNGVMTFGPYTATRRSRGRWYITGPGCELGPMLYRDARVRGGKLRDELRDKRQSQQIQERLRFLRKALRLSNRSGMVAE